MALHREHSGPPGQVVLTASLTTGVARVAHGLAECSGLVDDILTLDHADSETILLVGDFEYHQSAQGPYPDHQMRVSVQPSEGYAALNYSDASDSEMFISNSYNPAARSPSVYLVFNGSTGSVFPRCAAIPIDDARSALNEWLHTRQRPTCIEWRPYDAY
jgi:hypothetical protein